MMSIEDESSRDSGICDMDITEMSTTFDCLADLDENELRSELMKLSEEPFEERRRAPFSSLSNKPVFRRTNTIYDESPKSRTLFVRPCLTIRGQENRKRPLESNDPIGDSKRRLCEPSTSRLIQRVHSTSVIERGINSQQLLPKSIEVAYHLKTISPSTSAAYRSITAETMVELLSTMNDDEFREKYYLIDCRYPYEYNGGHIRNAINIYDPQECEKLFYNKDGSKKTDKIPIFYCEYSQKRGPSMALALRRFDRKINELRYPHCDYHEMYVLDKGFRNFFAFTRQQQVSEACEPDSYIPMDDARFVNELKRWTFHKKVANGTIEVSRCRMMIRSEEETISRRPLFTKRIQETAMSPTSLGRLSEDVENDYCRFNKIKPPQFS